MRALTVSFAAATMVTAAWVVVVAQREIRADLTAGPARFAAQRWAEGVAAPASRAQWEAALAELQEAVAIQGQSAVLREVLGNAWMVGTAQSWATAEERGLWARQAQEQFQRATQLRPSEGLGWALLAGAKAAGGDLGKTTQDAALRAIQLGPNEGHVHQAVMTLVLEHWDRLDPALQTWAGNVFDNGTQAQREAINGIGARFGFAFESELPPRDPGGRRPQGGS